VTEPEQRPGGGTAAGAPLPEEEGASRRQLLWSLGLFVLLTAICSAPYILGGRVWLPGDQIARNAPWSASMEGAPAEGLPFRYDVVFAFYTANHFLGDSIARGDFPLWCPLIFSGYPFVSDGLSGALYPPKALLCALLPQAHAHQWLLMLHLLANGWFMYLCLRSERLGEAASRAGGVAWMLHGSFVAWFSHGQLVLIGVFVPLSLWAFGRWERRGDPRFLALAGLFLAGLFYPGHASMGMLYAVYLLPYFLYRCLVSPRGRNPRWAAGLANYGRLLAVFALTAAPVLLPVYLNGRASQRSLFPAAFDDPALLIPLVPEYLLTLVAPLSMGPYSDGSFWVRHGATVVGCFAFCGLWTLLAFASGWRGWLDRRRAFHLAALVVVLLVSMGLWPFRYLWLLLPGGAQQNQLAYGFQLFFLPFILLAAYGADAMLAGDSPRRLRRWTLALLAAVVLAGVGAGLVAWLGEAALVEAAGGHAGRVRLALEQLRFSRTPFLLPAVFAAAYAGLALLGRMRLLRLALPVVLFLELLLPFWRLQPAAPVESVTFGPTEATRFLSEHSEEGRVLVLEGSGAFPRNGLLPYGLPALAGYQSLFPRGVAEWDAALTAGRPAAGRTPDPRRHVSFPFPRSAALDRAGARWVVSRGPLHAPGLELRIEGEGLRVYENETALPRAFFTRSWRTVSDEKALLRSLSARPVDETVLLQETPPGYPPESSGGVVDDAARIVEASNNRVVVEVEAEEDGLLVLSDTLAPGWSALVDGAPAPIAAVDHRFRGVFLKAGRHAVRFTYRPPGFRLGLLMALAGLALAALPWPRPQ